MKRKKGIKKVPHLRTSKRGRKFRAGRGKRKVKRIRRAYIPSKTLSDLTPQQRLIAGKIMKTHKIPSWKWD